MGAACPQRRDSAPEPAGQGEEESENSLETQQRWAQLLRHALRIRRQQRFYAYLGHHLNRHLNKRLRDRLKRIYLQDDSEHD